jgi:hypothetical protein
MNYFFMHGEWPENSNEAMKSGLNINYAPYSDNFIKEVTVSNGAIHFTFGKELPGKTLTLRPAVPAEDPSGPIVWVCGDSKASKNWAIQGDNRTNIDERYIPRSWR